MTTHAPVACCIAATPIDTDFGRRFLESIGCACLAESLTSSPEEQTRLQLLSPSLLQERCRSILCDKVARGATFGVIYCNSLSSVLDLPALERNTGLRIITPFDAYRRIAPQYQSFACIAANASGLEGVTRQIHHHHPGIRSIGFENLAIVSRIERKDDPDDIIYSCGIGEFLAIAAKCRIETLLLACTHFPYITDAVIDECRRRNHTLTVLDIDMGLRIVIADYLTTQGIRSVIPLLSKTT